MGSPSRSVRALAFAGVFLATALAPVALADHAFSHRYIVFGRLLDEAGNPVIGKQVEVRLDEGLGKVESLCARQPNTGTDAWPETTTRAYVDENGEYTYCFHMHGASRASLQVRAIVDGQELGAAATNHVFRRNFLPIVLSGANGTASPTFDSTYLVAGRLMFKAGQTTVEGIGVEGDTFKFETVTVTYTPDTGDAASAKTRTNNYGDFAVRLNASKALGPGTITIATEDKSFSYPADTKFRATDVNIELPDPKWLSRTLAKFGPLVVLLGVVGAGAYFFLRGSGTAKMAKKAKR